MTAAMERLGDPLRVSGGRDDRRRGQAVRGAVRERAAALVGDPELLDDIELMTSEALANAVLHGSGPIGVTVATNGRRLRVEVRDEGPAAAPAEPGRRRTDHGRGLTVIGALAADWALERSETETRLWFEVELRPRRSG
ncbi:ATP-binding protein [Actinomadura sp. SCN-SB]|uniref:ATP-binding protein n=1 Tax=Actinomadura sp. SCN-SB TaxID=3373092 RepID=UPI003752A010